MTIGEFYERLENMEMQAADFEEIADVCIERHWQKANGQPCVPKWAIHWLETQEKNEILITGLNDLLDKVAPPVPPLIQTPPTKTLPVDESMPEAVANGREYTREKLHEVLQNGEIVYFRHSSNNYDRLDFQAIYHRPREGNPARVFEWRNDGKMYALSTLTKIVFNKINLSNNSGAYDGYVWWVNNKGTCLFDLVRKTNDGRLNLFSE